MKAKHLNVVDKNFNLHSCLLPAKTAGMSVERTKNLTYTDCGISCDTFNIIHITDGQHVTISELETALEHYLKQDFAFCLWVCKKNLTEKLRAFLRSLKLKQVASEAGMELDLPQYKATPTNGLGSIRVITSKEQINTFAFVLSLNWSPPDQNLVSYYGKASQAILQQDRGILFACYFLDEEPVATIELFPTDNKTIGIYNLSTREDHRGKGIGTALMSFALNMAKDKGYETAVLLASKDGINIYKRFGFRETTSFFGFK
ncbi:GNAT family N-acetyltransferase [Pontibacter silvestris]|uniref:GNAT family N-acetyltransferase n=1 Tax=Pontibacter silvestris TaxID=2305183 RepID=A0ABW4X011_9BACT|nr:GNAT family N-acetyltransferase [Pontibacter silvestris]MCC9136742.1 GNAT family N-acetyltransferase [Pontibacter silvestris]